MRALLQGRDPVEEIAAPGDDFSAALGIIAFGGGIRRRKSVRSVKRVIRRAPAGVGGVQRIAGVGDRHDELRPGLGRDLGIDIGRADFEIIARAARDSRSRSGRPCRPRRREFAAPFAMPGVDLRLQVVPPGEQGAIARRQIDQETFEAGPESLRAQVPRPGSTSAVDELLEDGGDFNSPVTKKRGHAGPLSKAGFVGRVTRGGLPEWPLRDPRLDVPFVLLAQWRSFPREILALLVRP